MATQIGSGWFASHAVNSIPGSSVADLELAELAAVGLDRFLPCPDIAAQVDLDRLDESIQFGRLAHRDQVDSAVGEILHIACHVELGSDPSRRITETHPLDPSLEVDLALLVGAFLCHAVAPGFSRT